MQMRDYPRRKSQSGIGTAKPSEDTPDAFIFAALRIMGSVSGEP